MKKAARAAFVALIWLAIWEGLALAVGREVLLPAPTAVVRALWRLAGTGSFWRSVLGSLLRILSGFAAGVAGGCLLAALTARFRFCRTLFSPALSVVKATPVASFILLALVWLRAGAVPVFATFLIVLPLVWANVQAGIDATDAKLLEMARAYGMPWHRVALHVYAPSVRPYFRAATTTGMGMAWKAGIAAEVICTPMLAVGSGLYDAKISLDTAGLFAWTAVVILLSVALEKLIRGRV